MTLRRFIDAVARLTEAEPPEPTQRDLLDAIEHADLYQIGWQLDDFALRYLGHLSVDELGEYDDLSSWPEVATPDDLATFRDGQYANPAPHLIAAPIIIITTPEDGTCHTQIGDGRGRVNYAIAHALRLHAWHLIHKDCAE